MKNLASYYVLFTTLEQASTILEVFAQKGWSYKNGTIDDAMAIIQDTCVDKITCHDKFVMTSKPKDKVLDFDSFMAIVNSSSVNTSTTNPISTMSTSNYNTAQQLLNSVKAKKFFEDEKKVQAVVDTIESVDTLAKNFGAAMQKAQDKNNKLLAINNQLALAVGNEDVIAVEKYMALIAEAQEFITNTNKVLASLNSTGAKIVKANTKDDKSASGADYIGD